MRYRLIESPWAGKCSGFRLLFEAFVPSLCRERPFAAVARLVGESWHRVAAIAGRYMELALATEDLSDVHELAIDETSKTRAHDYVMIAEIFVTEACEAQVIERLAAELALYGGDPEAILDVKHRHVAGVNQRCRPAFAERTVTFDKIHAAHASHALDI